MFHCWDLLLLLFPESVLDLASLVEQGLDFFLNLVSFGINIVQSGKVTVFFFIQLSQLVLDFRVRGFQRFALGVKSVELLAVR